MKRLLVLAAVLFCGFSTFAAQDFPIKFKKKHHGRHYTPNSPCNGHGCLCDGGICIIIGIADNPNDVLTQAEIADDFGRGQVSLTNIQTVYLDPPTNTMSKTVGKLRIVFNQYSATSAGDVPFDQDWYVEQAVVQRLGYSNIKVLAGNYQIVYPQGSQNGEVYLDCQLYP